MGGALYIKVISKEEKAWLKWKYEKKRKKRKTLNTRESIVVRERVLAYKSGGSNQLKGEGDWVACVSDLACERGVLLV